MRETGVRAFGHVVLFLRSPTREKYLRWIAGAFPRYLRTYETAYAGRVRLAGAYRRRLDALLERLRARHGFVRESEDETKADSRPAQQLALWP